MYRVDELVEIHDENLGIHDIGKILYMIPGEMYPYQVLLEKGDNDGHRVYRFNENQLHPYGEERPSEEPTERLKVVEVVQAKQTFKSGHYYYARLREGGTHYTLYNSKMACRGVMPVDMFKNTSLNRIAVRSKSVETENNTNTLVKVKTPVTKREAAKIEITRIVTKIIKEKKIKKASTHYEKMELLGQMNLFDMEG